MKRRYSHKHPLKTFRRALLARRLATLFVSAGFALLGYTLINSSSAATYATSKQAEAATLTGKAALEANSAASGGSSVKFGGATTSGEWTDADLFVDPQSNAAKQAVTWASSNPAGAARMRKMAQGPMVEWIGDWFGTKDKVLVATQNYMNRVTAAGGTKIGLIAMYAIPYRDCGGASGGGYVDANTYAGYVQAVSQGIGQKRAIIVLEPDALPQLTTCLSAAQQTARLQMMSNAVTYIKTNNKNTRVYIDAGNSGWVAAGTIADRLKRANIAAADGFATNVSNFKFTANEITYGNSVSSMVGGKRYIIDTSRNGAGPGNTWCNPDGRALGAKATFSTNSNLVDMFLWIKQAGESDGNTGADCAGRGAPGPGQWWPAYADGMAQRAGY